ncbi:hypothetical protein BC829DRAFT_437855 [Chytridium lagenaria]|nr:hypothetical protein BC829DRAFT_437855 [Chytridium lagenaria]
MESEGIESVTATARYVSTFVRDVLWDEQRKNNMLRDLSRDRPYVESESMAVVMIDISGYSTLTTNLALFGKISSELITKHIGAYLKKIIDIVYLYGGDVVKFLGDAVLVIFGRTDSLQQAIRRASRCCLHIMLRAAVYCNDRGLGKVNGVFGSIRSDDVPKTFKLTLHVALTAGLMNHVVIGIKKDRLDYVVDGVCLRDLGEIIDEAKSGELGVSLLAWNIIKKDFASLSDVKEIKDLPSAIVVKQGGLLDVFIAISGLSRGALSMEIANGDSANHGDGERIDINEYKTPDEEFAMRVNPNDLLRRNISTTLEASSAQLLDKFVNKSIVHKIKMRSTMQKNIVDRKTAEGNRGGKKVANVISSEFRQLSIVFVKIKGEFQAEMAQKTLVLFLQSLAKYGGVFQQYSVDDKGQTMLACFGLPPYTHENDSRRALRASAEFCANVRKHKLGDIYTSVSTGELMFASIGSEKRLEASFLGDAVNIAARIIGLGISKSFVVCDEKTKISSEGLDFRALGGFKVKGKVHPLELFGVDLESFPDNSEKETDSQEFVGYPEERQSLLDLFKKWHEKGTQGLGMIEGASGMGKSKILELTNGGVAHGFKSLGSMSLANSRAQSRAISRSGSLTADNIGRRASMAGPSHMKRNMMEEMHKYDAVEFLHMFGEDGKLAPILSGLIPGIKITESDEINGLDGKAKKALLTGMIARIVESFTASCKTVFVFDDAQWLDPISLEIIYNIVRFCPKSNFIFFTRPIEEMKIGFLRQIRQLDTTVYHSLQGFTIADVEQLIISRFLFADIKRVSERLKKAIFERGGGSPLASDMIMESLKLRSPEALKVMEGELDFASENINMDGLFAKTLGAAITIQFDRINGVLQEFLKHASILGQYYHLSDAIVLLGADVTVREVRDWIEAYDRFKFLILPNDIIPYRDTRRGSAVNEDLAEEEAAMEYRAGECYFRHIAIMTTIYDSLPFGERQALHLKAAQYFEAMLLEEGDRSALLPTVSFHYYRSGAVEKTVTYLEELGMLHLKKFLFSECISTIENLISFANTIDLKRNDIDQAFKNGIKDPENVLKCFELLGLKWPKNDREVRGATIKAALEQYKLFKKTKAPSSFGRTGKTRFAEFGGQGIVSCSAYNPVMFSNDMKALILFWNLNTAIKDAYKDPITWGFFCNCAAFGFSWKYPKLAQIYINRSLEVEKKNGNKSYAGFHFYGISLTENLQFTKSYEIFEKVIRYSRLTGDVVNEYCGLYYQSIANWLKGRISMVPEILSLRLGAASQHDIIWPACAACSMIRAAMMQDNMDQFDSYISRLVAIAEGLKIPYFLPPLQMGRAWINYRSENNPAILLKLFVEMSTTVSIWNEYAIAVAEGVLSGAILIWLLVDQCLPALDSVGGKISAESKHDPKTLFTTKDAMQLRTAAQSISKITQTLRKKMYMEFVGVIGIFYDAAAAILQSGGRRAGVAKLKKFLKSPKYESRLKDELQLLRALALSFIGAYSDNEHDKKPAHSEALQLMTGYDAFFFVRWLKTKGANAKL